MRLKVGIGFDVHDFIDDRPLIVGGITVPYPKGLQGHSDADVLLHAIMDSFLGVTIGKDIGNIFPDNDVKYKNIDSKILLKNAYDLVLNAGYKISNIDAVIIAQEPKMAKHIPAMREVISTILNIPIDDITIKATTTEHLGFVGRKEGIAVLSTAVVMKGEL